MAKMVYRDDNVKFTDERTWLGLDLGRREKVCKVKKNVFFLRKSDKLFYHIKYLLYICTVFVRCVKVM